MKTRTGSFTLIELLVVIVIICILAGLLYPAVLTAIQRAEISRASAEARHLANAFESYRTELMYWPVLPNSNRYSAAQLAGSNDIAIDSLLMKRMAYLADPELGYFAWWLWSVQPVKKQQRAYLAYNTNQFRTCYDAQLGTNLFLVDSWGNPWQIRFDMDEDNQVPNPFGGAPVRASVIVWSAGPDHTNETTGGETARRNRDNPRSWQ
jgi:prepilin-type N-terminal cleavage/methylation domain-containing protein